MDFAAFIDFLFNTYAGIGVLIGICLVLSVIACIIMERRTKKRFVDRKKTKDDWSLFDDDDEDEEEDGKND